jgi:hypothetical protein
MSDTAGSMVQGASEGTPAVAYASTRGQGGMPEFDFQIVPGQIGIFGWLYNPDECGPNQPGVGGEGVGPPVGIEVLEGVGLEYWPQQGYWPGANTGFGWLTGNGTYHVFLPYLVDEFWLIVCDYGAGMYAWGH